MKVRYILLFWVVILVGIIGLTLYMNYLTRRYGAARVFYDMTDVMLWIGGLSVGLMTGIGIFAGVRRWRKRRGL